ncbi:MAG TPA: tRNA (adenosine(37)-N6)-dimethylallyltransferase MiaA [Chloroflexota bacterium]|nr:tRNA (adenosine(37)-N6)-dimethylallyltransferase MiaA [Chloroflexota bacterium]
MVNRVLSPGFDPQVVVITGATGVGKTALAIEVARRIGGEVISADSRQVYHYMDVGTAKPTAAERAAAPHHLIDVVYPDEPFSVATYQHLGERALADIAGRGRVALIVGGSPHYIQALVDRLQPGPRSPVLRRWLERADARDGPSRLNRWLAVLDPLAARTIDPRNRRRVIRALEVTIATGIPFSRSGRQRGVAIPARWIGLRRDRRGLHEILAQRFDRMLQHGWLDEVRTLLAMGFEPTLPSMSATGYADLAQVVLQRAQLGEARDRVLHATHAFVRRQETWLRAERRVEWFDAADPTLADRVVRALREPSGLAPRGAAAD